MTLMKNVQGNNNSVLKEASLVGHVEVVELLNEAIKKQEEAQAKFDALPEAERKKYENRKDWKKKNENRNE